MMLKKINFLRQGLERCPKSTGSWAGVSAVAGDSVSLDSPPHRVLKIARGLTFWRSKPASIYSVLIKSKTWAAWLVFPPSSWRAWGAGSELTAAIEGLLSPNRVWDQAHLTMAWTLSVLGKKVRPSRLEPTRSLGGGSGAKQSLD